MTVTTQAQRGPRSSVLRAQWTKQGQSWRIEQEIPKERQEALRAMLETPVSIPQNVYPFKRQQLSRADLEWLLAEHESNGIKGPVDWSDKKQRQRSGLDLRGADLRGVNLRGLPLAKMIGGLTREEMDRDDVTAKNRIAACARLEKANLGPLTVGGLKTETHIEGAVLTDVSFVGAKLQEAHFESAESGRAHFDGAILTNTHFEEAHLEAAAFDSQSVLTNTKFDGAFLFGVTWNARGKVANLAGPDWAGVSRLGEETVADHRRGSTGKKTRDERLAEYDTAVGAYNQLAQVLQAQGLGEEADRFAYRSAQLKRRMLRMRGRIRGWMGSVALDALAGYGYRPVRLVLFYIVVLLLYAVIYFTLTHVPGMTAHPLAVGESVGVSVQVVLGHSIPDSGAALDPINVIADTEILVSLGLGFVFANLIGRRYFNR